MLMKWRKGCDKLEMPSWRACADISLLPFREGNWEDEKIAVEVWPSSQSKVSVVSDYSAIQIARTVTRFRNKGRQGRSCKASWLAIRKRKE